MRVKKKMKIRLASRSLYKTYDEFLETMKRLKISSFDDYKKAYKEDPRLPCRPYHFYKPEKVSFKSLSDTRPYETYEECVNAARKLGIYSYESYIKLRQKDPRLRGNPQEHYKDKGWISWELFRKLLCYQTYKEFVEAVRRLNITSYSEYQELYTKDPLLPRYPEIIYKEERHKGFKTWDAVFLVKNNFYETYGEFVEAVRRLEIWSYQEYRHGYAIDPRLHRFPNEYYVDKGWVPWKVLFGQE